MLNHYAKGPPGLLKKGTTNLLEVTGRDLEEGSRGVAKKDSAGVKEGDPLVEGGNKLPFLTPLPLFPLLPTLSPLLPLCHHILLNLITKWQASSGLYLEYRGSG
jgi:hypothetical protein